MKLSLPVTTVSALTALAACAPPAAEPGAPPRDDAGSPDKPPQAGQPPQPNRPGLKPDLSWVEPDFGWTAVTASNAPPARLTFGKAETDHIMMTITCGDAPDTLDFAYFANAPESDGETTNMVITSTDATPSEMIPAQAECPYSQLHDGCVTTATMDRTDGLSALLTANQPIRFTVAGEGKWYPAPGAAGEEFLAACRSG